MRVEEVNYDSFEIPGVPGEIKARQGTSTHELCGAIKYWHDRYNTEVVSVRQSAFIAGAASTLLIGLIAFAIYWLW